MVMRWDGVEDGERLQACVYLRLVFFEFALKAGLIYTHARNSLLCFFPVAGLV